MQGLVCTVFSIVIIGRFKPMLKKKQDFIASIIYFVQTKAMFFICMCDSVCVMLFHQINKSTCSYTWQPIEAIKRIDLDKVKD